MPMVNVKITREGATAEQKKPSDGRDDGCDGAGAGQKP